MSAAPNHDSTSPSVEADRACVLAALEQLEPVPAEIGGTIKGAALRWNDLYLHGLVEEHGLCPFAREGRKRGTTARRVHVRVESSAEEELFRLREVADEVLSRPDHEVTQLVFPGWALSYDGFERFARALTRLAHESRGGPEVVAVAPLHPHAPYNDRNPYALIPLFRRTPDPTIQWVRHDALARVAAGKEKGSTFIDPAKLMSMLEEPPAQPLYDRVAEVNEKTARRLGLEQLERRFAELHAGAQRQYALSGAPACLCSVVA